MPEKTLKKLNTYILPEWRACFFAALFVGLFAHLYKITNWLPNWDSLVFRYDAQKMTGLGRWFLPVASAGSSFYDLPFVNGILAIILHAVSAVCICRMLHVKKKITAVLIGSIIVSFPTVTSVLMYNYVADGYSIAFLLATVSAMFLTQEKPKYILSSVLIALSVGIYQAYITVTIMLVLVDLIDKTIYYGMEAKTILKKGIRIFTVGFAGMVLYYVILQLVLRLSDTQLLEYQGMNAAMSFGGFNIAASLYAAKETFLGCFFDMSEGLNIYVFLNIAIVIFTLFHYIKYIMKIGLYKKPAEFLLMLMMSVMLILGASVLVFINPQVDYHNLMLMGYVAFYLFFIILYERGAEEDTAMHARIKAWGILGTALMVIFNQCIISNVSYHKAQMAYEKSFGTLIRIADRIEQTPDAAGCDTILVVGELPNSSQYSVNLTPDITGITDGYILRKDDETVGQSVLTSALCDYCEKDYSFLSGEKKKEFLEKQTVLEMPFWPEKDAVKVVDNTIVIKLGAERE